MWWGQRHFLLAKSTSSGKCVWKTFERASRHRSPWNYAWNSIPFWLFNSLLTNWIVIILNLHYAFVLRGRRDIITIFILIGQFILDLGLCNSIKEIFVDGFVIEQISRLLVFRYLDGFKEKTWLVTNPNTVQILNKKKTIYLDAIFSDIQWWFDSNALDTIGNYSN